MAELELEDDLDCLDDLPPLPTILTRLLACLGRRDLELSELDGVVRQDLVLAARVLRAANSAVYGARVPARTTREALLRLGTVEVRRLALALAAANTLPLAGPGPEYRRFWLHSLGVAWTAEEIGRHARRLPPGIGPDELFLAGLFHDLGELLLMSRYPGVLAEVRRFGAEHQLRQFEAELVVLGADHGELGARVARRWGMPDFVVETVRAHHRIDRAWAPFRDHAAVIAAADFLYGLHGLGDLGEQFRLELTEDTWEVLGLGMLGLDLAGSRALAEGAAAEATRCATILAA
jgi:HD-like signal output (HDOD) protein